MNLVKNPCVRINWLPQTKSDYNLKRYIRKSNYRNFKLWHKWPIEFQCACRKIKWIFLFRIKNSYKISVFLISLYSNVSSNLVRISAWQVQKILVLTLGFLTLQSSMYQIWFAINFVHHTNLKMQLKPVVDKKYTF